MGPTRVETRDKCDRKRSLSLEETHYSPEDPNFQVPVRKGTFLQRKKKFQFLVVPFKQFTLYFCCDGILHQPDFIMAVSVPPPLTF
jgi:hypothetical protein